MSTPTVPAVPDASIARREPRTPLGVFQAALEHARVDLAEKRHHNDRVLPAARATVLRALEAYVAELDARQLPIPYALRDELRIQQRVPATSYLPRGPAEWLAADDPRRGLR